MSEVAPSHPADVVLPVGAVIAVLVAWHFLVASTAIPPYLLPAPAAVFGRLFSEPGLYLANGVATFRKICYGGAAGIGAGVVLAVVVSVVEPARRALVPYLVTIRVLPKVAVAPVFLIYLGTGTETAVLFVAMIAFFPMVLSTIAGLERVPERYLDLLRSVDAGRIRAFVAVRVRFAVPDLVAGLKQSVTLAVVGTVVAEWVVADDGLGYLILLASENVRTEVMLAALFVLFLEGLLLYGAVAAVGRWLLGYEDVPE